MAGSAMSICPCPLPALPQTGLRCGGGKSWQATPAFVALFSSVPLSCPPRQAEFPYAR